MDNQDFKVENLQKYESVIKDITALEQKIENELGKHVALIAYTEEENK